MKSTIAAIVGGAIILAAILGLSFGKLGGETGALLITLGAGLLGVKPLAMLRSKRAETASRQSAERSRQEPVGRKQSEMGHPRVWFLILALAVLAGINALGCSWRVPLSDRLSAEQRAQYVALEQCCRSHGASMWSGYLHSLPGT